MTRFCIGRLALAAVAAAFAGLAQAQTPQWTLTLEPPPDGRRGPLTPIRIAVPAKISIETLRRLALEIDNIDVTALLRREGAFAVLVPAQPLAPGEHLLRVVEYAADGELVERGRWTLEVRATDRFRDAGAEVNATLNVAQRIADDSLVGEPGETSSNGSLMWRGEVADGDWRVRGTLPFLYDKAAADRNLEIGDYLVEGSWGRAHANLGHHGAAPESLVSDGLYRRGVSAGYASADARHRVAAFSVHASALRGFDDGLGVQDSGDRVSGAHAASRVLDADGATVDIGATYLDGEGPLEGDGVAGDPAASGGRAASMYADAGWSGGRYRARGEYAWSDYDFDGSGALEPERDRAHALLLSAQPWSGTLLRGAPMHLTVGIEQRRIGTFFRSPGAPGTAPDRDALRGFADFSWSGIGLQAHVSRELTNVADSDLLPTLATHVSGLTATWNPAPADPAMGFGTWGQPSLALVLSRQVSEARTVPVAYAGAVPDSKTWLWAATATFLHEDWHWTLSHWVTDTDDEGGQTPSPRATITDLSAAIRFGERVTLAPRAQLGRTENTALGTEDTNRSVGADIEFTLPGERIGGRVGIDVSEDRVPAEPRDVRSRVVSAAAHWIAWPVRATLPGLTLSLEGTWQDSADRLDPTQDRDSYQIFLKATVHWATRY